MLLIYLDLELFKFKKLIVKFLLLFRYIFQLYYLNKYVC